MATRIGILTGGGDVPGLNSVIKSVVYRAIEMGWEVLGIRRGWEGLTHGQPGTLEERDYFWQLTRENTRTIERTGGTMLHTSRLDPQRVAAARLPAHLEASVRERHLLPSEQEPESRYDLLPIVRRNLELLAIDCLIAIGGDGTLGATPRLHRDGVKLI